MSPRTAWWLVVAVGAALLGGCDGCGGTSEDDGSALMATDLGPPVDDVPVPGAIYDEAYERAMSTLDPDTAAARLREIEREVTLEREAMR